MPQGAPWLSISKSYTHDIVVTHNVFSTGANAKYDPGIPSITVADNHTFGEDLSDFNGFLAYFHRHPVVPPWWEKTIERVKRFALKISPTQWEPTPALFLHMTQEIVHQAKTLGPDVTVDCSHMKDPQNPRIVVKNLPKEFVNKNGLPSDSFELLLKYPYDGRYCDVL